MVLPSTAMPLPARSQPSFCDTDYHAGTFLFFSRLQIRIYLGGKKKGKSSFCHGGRRGLPVSRGKAQALLSYRIYGPGQNEELPRVSHKGAGLEHWIHPLLPPRHSQRAGREVDMGGTAGHIPGTAPPETPLELVSCTKGPHGSFRPTASSLPSHAPPGL